MADLPDLNPLRQVWPVQPGDRSGPQKPALQEKPGGQRERKPRKKTPRDENSQGHIDEYA